MSMMCEVCKCTVERETLACENGCTCCNKPESESKPVRQQLAEAIRERELWASTDLYEVGYLDALKRVAADMESEGESGLEAELQRWRDYAGELETRIEAAGAGYEDIEAEYFPEYEEAEAPANDTLEGRTLQLLATTEEVREAGYESNPIVYAEQGPNRFALMSLFFSDSDGVKIEEDLDLSEVTVAYFNADGEQEITEGALYEWATKFYAENY